MSNKNLLKIANISGWILLIILLLYFISGYAMVRQYGMDALMTRPHAWFWHKYLTVPFLIFLVLHIVPYYIVRKQIKRFLIILSIVIAVPVIGVYAVNEVYKESNINPPARKRQQIHKTIKDTSRPAFAKKSPCSNYKSF